MTTSINTNIAAYYAQANITAASNSAQSSVARLSSGNAIVQASDNVAALATGTSLATQVSALKTAQTNAAQGSSLLQVADGALAQIQGILQQQQSLSLQAGSGSLTNTDRAFLNQQFSALTNEINSLATGTTFNGVGLIDGSISGGASINTNTTNGSSNLPVSASIASFGANAVAGDTITVKVSGQTTQTFTFGSGTGQIAVGATAADSASNLSSALNNSGLSQLSDFRFQTGSDSLGNPNVSAYYTGHAASISNIPALTIGTTSTAFTTTAAPVFTAATQIGLVSGNINAGDTFSIGSHTVTFAAGNTNAAAGGYVVTGGNISVDIGTTGNSTGSTATAFTNLVTALNTASGAAGFSDISGISFSQTTATPVATGISTYALNAAFSGVGANQPKLSTTFTPITPTNFGGGSSQNVSAATTILTLNANSLTKGSSAITIGNATINVGTSAQAAAALVSLGTTSATIDGGGALAATLANVVSYLNGATANPLLGAGYAGAVYSTDGTHLFSSNATNTNATITTALSNGGPLGATVLSTPLTSQKVAAFTVTAGAFGAATTLTLAGNNFTFAVGAAAGNTGASLAINIGANNTESLAGITTYLNAHIGTNTPAGVTYSSDATNIYATNPTAGSLSVITNLTAAGGSGLTGSDSAGALVVGTPSTNVVAANNGTILTTTGGGASLTVANGSVFNVGGVDITFVPLGTTPPATSTTHGFVALGANDTATLANIATYLNSAAGQGALTAGGTSLAGQVFTSGTNTLLVSNATGATVTSGTAAVSFTAAPTVPPTGTTVVTGISHVASAVVGTFSGGGNVGSGDVITLGLTDTAINNASLITGSTALITLGGKSIQLGTAAQVTAGTANVVAGPNNYVTLNNIANYLNANATTLNAGFATAGVANFTFSTDGTSLKATNNTLVTQTTTGALAFTSGTPATAPTIPGAAGAVTAGTTVNLLTLAPAATTLVFGTAAQITAGKANVLVGGSLAASLANATSYLNNPTVATLNTDPIPKIAGTAFSTNGTQLLAEFDDNTGIGNTSTLSSKFYSASAVSFTGVTGQLITASSVTGLGAGVTSAQGLPGGSLFVSSKGTGVTNYGNAVDLSAISNNSAFVGAFGGAGSIGAISSNYINTGVNATSGVQFSVKVGNDTYTTNTITNTQLSSATAPVSLVFNGNNTLTSAVEGGSFTLTLQPQPTINSQNGADQLATGINASLATVSSYQNRNVLSFNNNYSSSVSSTLTATLAGASLSFNSNDFSAASISGITVDAPTNGSTDAKLSAIVNGQTYSTTSGIGATFAANNEIVLVNQQNPNQTLTLTLGSAGFANLSNTSNASAFQSTLSSALGLSTATGGLNFQLGSTAAANVSVTIGSAKSTALFAGSSLDISTQLGASAAAKVVASAIDGVTSLRAGVGALESQFNFAAAALQTSVQNQDAARGSLLDTDIASESTSYATSQVKLQAGISVLAQANQSLQALLKLIG